MEADEHLLQAVDIAVSTQRDRFTRAADSQRAISRLFDILYHRPV